jgi:hypothetical protein
LKKLGPTCTGRCTITVILPWYLSLSPSLATVITTIITSASISYLTILW